MHTVMLNYVSSFVGAAAYLVFSLLIHSRLAPRVINSFTTYHYLPIKS
jgi:hypothetical protein